MVRKVILIFGARRLLSLKIVKCDTKVVVFLQCCVDQVNLLSLFEISKENNLRSFLAPFLREIDICAYWLLYTEFHAEQLLFEAFLYIIHIFGSVEASRESIFPMLYSIIFQRWQSLELLSSTPGRDKHVCLLTFLYKIQCLTTFIWNIFRYNAYFWQHRAPKWNYFPVFKYYNILMTAIFRGTSSSLEEIDVCAYWLFCTEFHAQQLLFEEF